MTTTKLLLLVTTNCDGEYYRYLGGLLSGIEQSSGACSWTLLLHSELHGTET